MQEPRFDAISALVTGAGRGMGREVAVALAARGAHVIIADIDRTNAEAAAAAIRQAGGRADAFQVDVSDRAALRKMYEAVDTIVPRLGVMVCAAAVIRPKPFLDHDEADWDYMANVNLKGTFFSVQEAARRMVRHGSGAIVTFCSTSAFVSSRIPEIAYDVTKGGIRQLTISAAAELAPHGIRVNGVAPGTILTDFNRSSLDTPEKIRSVEAKLPLGRVGNPQDVVGATLFLCSPAAGYITGHLLVVDGGRLCRAG